MTVEIMSAPESFELSYLMLSQSQRLKLFERSGYKAQFCQSVVCGKWSFISFISPNRRYSREKLFSLDLNLTPLSRNVFQ